MADSLIKIDEEIVTSPVASVELGGANWDSSYDVYMVKYNNLKSSVDGDAKIRVTKSGTPDATSNYDRANKILRSDTTFSNDSGTNETFWYLEYIGDDASEASNGIMYLFNFNNASEYSFLTMEITSSDNANPTLKGRQGGGVHTVASASDGIQIFPNSGNITSGTFTLYGLAK